MTTTARHPTTGVWHHRTLRVLLGAETISMLGTQFSAVAMPWLAFKLTGSATDMGLVMAAQIAAVAVTGFFGASLTGRIGPRRIMLLGDTVRGPLVALLAILYYLHALNTGTFVAVMFTIGMFFAPYTASQQAILPAVVGEDEQLLSRANAALQSATRLSVLLGPILGGVLVSVLSAPAALLLDAVSFAASAILLRLRLPDVPIGGAVPRKWSLGAGLHVLVRDRLLGIWSLALALGELAWQGLFALLPVIAIERGGGSSVVSGVLLASFGGGALAGTLVVGALLRRLSSRKLALAGRIALGVAFLALPLPLGVPGLAVVLIVAGFLNGSSSAPVNAVRVLRIPAGQRSETLTVATALALVGGSAGWVLAGIVVQGSGLATAFAGLAVLQVVAATLFTLGALADRKETGS